VRRFLTHIYRLVTVPDGTHATGESSRRHCINCFARCEPVDTSQPATLVQARLKRKYNDLTPISRGSVASPPRPVGRERISFADSCPRASHAALSTSPIAVPSRFASLSQGPRGDGGMEAEFGSSALRGLAQLPSFSRLARRVHRHADGRGTSCCPVAGGLVAHCSVRGGDRALPQQFYSYHHKLRDRTLPGGPRVACRGSSKASTGGSQLA
jgi:hypothetical protein